MTDYHPYPDRKEHDYVNEMTVVIARARLVIRDASQVIDRLQNIVDEYIEVTKQTRNGDD